MFLRFFFPVPWHGTLSEVPTSTGVGTTRDSLILLCWITDTKITYWSTYLDYVSLGPSSSRGYFGNMGYMIWRGHSRERHHDKKGFQALFLA